MPKKKHVIVYRGGRHSQKVRTGCITCKIRKVKCDEVKPACGQCKSTGRQCDGYLSVQSKSELPSSVPDVQTPRPLASLSTMPAREPHETKLLDLYCRHMIRVLHADTNRLGDFALLALRFTMSDRTVSEATLAVAACFNANTTGSELQIKEQTLFKHYNNAIAGTRQRLDMLLSGSATSDEWIALLITMLQFIELEGIRGNWDAGRFHLARFGEIVKSYQIGKVDLGPISGTFSQLYKRMSVNASILPSFEFYTRVSYPRVNRPNSVRTTNPLCLKTRQEILELFYVCLGDFVAAMHDLVESSGSSLAVARQRASLLVLRLQEWCFELKNSFASRQKDHEVLPHVQEIIVQAQSLSMIIRLQAQSRGHEEMYFDAYQEQFEELMALVSSIPTKAYNRRQAAWCHGSALACVHFVVVKCRDPSLRRRAISWLDAWGHLPEAWYGPSLLSLMARRIVELEEGNEFIDRADNIVEKRRLRAVISHIDHQTRVVTLQYQVWTSKYELQQKEEVFEC